MTPFVALVYTTCQAYQYPKANQHAGPGDVSREEVWGLRGSDRAGKQVPAMAAVATMV